MLIVNSMETKHTPGPWSCDHGDTPTVYPDNDKDYGIIADVYGDQAQANARLIAAAPELLEALKEMLTGLEEVNIPNDGHSVISTSYTMDIILKARKALDKATA